MSFDMPGGIPHFKGNKKGRIYLTTHRVDIIKLYLYIIIVNDDD